MHHAFHLYNTKKAAIYNRFQLVPSLFVNISFTKKVGKKCRGTRQVINYQLFLVVKSFIAWCHSCHASFCQKNNEAFNCRETKYKTNVCNCHFEERDNLQIGKKKKNTTLPVSAMITNSGNLGKN